MEFCHLELELSACNKDVAALHSDHYTWTVVWFTSASIYSPIISSTC